MSYFLFLIVNISQITALIGSLFLMIFSGLHLGWGIFNINFEADQELKKLFGMSHSTFWMIWLIISWFLSACLGLLVGAKLVNGFKKDRIYVS